MSKSQKIRTAKPRTQNPAVPITHTAAMLRAFIEHSEVCLPIEDFEQAWAMMPAIVGAMYEGKGADLDRTTVHDAIKRIAEGYIADSREAHAWTKSAEWIARLDALDQDAVEAVVFPHRSASFAAGVALACYLLTMPMAAIR